MENFLGYIRSHAFQTVAVDSGSSADRNASRDGVATARAVRGGFLFLVVFIALSSGKVVGLWIVRSSTLLLSPAKTPITSVLSTTATYMPKLSPMPRKLMLCSRIAKFDEVRTEIDPALTVLPDDRAGWTKTMVRLLRDEPWADELTGKIRVFAEATSWTNVGKLHWEHYGRLVSESR
jgi:hypothetical protein